MLKHKHISIVFFLLIVLTITADYWFDVHAAIYFILVLIFLCFEAFGAALIQSGYHLKATCKFETTEKIICLTFDDGPCANTENVLNILKEYHAKATFFCIGKNIAGHEEIIKRIHQEGHLIASHSFEHNYWYDLKTTAAFEKDLLLNTKTIKNVIGEEPRYFRPPYGVTTPALARAVAKLKLDVIGWNIRSLDTKIKNQKKLLSRIVKQIRPGSIVLLHDTMPDSNVVLRELLIYLKNENYQSVRIDAMMKTEAYV